MDISLSLNDHIVPITPNGTLKRNIYLQFNTANIPLKLNQRIEPNSMPPCLSLMPFPFHLGEMHP
jgi:hypothetical protein